MKVIDFKDAKCRHCYKCVRNCAVKAISVKDEQARIMVDHCINCGRCLEVCPQNAKTFASDLERVKGYLAQGFKTIISIAPSYAGVLDFDQPGQVVDALLKLGFYEVRETAEGAALVTNEYKKLVRENEMEDMYSILEQTRENIDGQMEIYVSLLNYLTYSPEILEVIENKDMDRYTAYEQYTEVVDPLLTVPKSYHDAILGIQLFAESIPVRHEYTLVPLDEMCGEWWSSKLDGSVMAQWIVDRDNRQIAAVREIYNGKKRDAVLCITLDYEKVFRPLANIIERNSGGIVVDKQKNVVYHGENLAASDISAQKSTEKMLDRLREEYTYVSTSGHETRWTYYFYKPPAVIESSVSKLLISEIPLIGFCVVIIIVLGMTFSKLFTRNIELLTRNMEQVNQGSREVTVYSDSQDAVSYTHLTLPTIA